MSFVRFRLAACGLILFVLAAGAATQEPAFEVSSVKISPPPTPRADGSFTVSLYVGPRPGGRWVANNSTLSMLLQAAYDGFRFPGQIVDAPDWATMTRFEVNAIAPVTGGAEPTQEQFNAMVRKLLADRFKLKVRTEQRDADVYVLTRARSDGRLGPRLRKAEVDCEALAEARKRGETVPDTPPPQPGQRPQCGSSGQVNGAVQRLMVGGMTISVVVGSVQSAVGRPVIDKTGLTGAWDVDLEYVRDSSNFRSTGPDVTPTQSAGPSVFTAIQEQLGLKLERGKDRMDVLVIEHVEMPTPD